MRSNVCKIEKGTKDLAAILAECERVAEYNGLAHKHAMQLRLLCEELDGMLPNVIDDFEGEIWIELENGVCKVKAVIEIPELDVSKKEDLIDVAKNKKNAAAVGIGGRIRCAIENFFLYGASVSAMQTSSTVFRLATGYNEGVDDACFWSLEQYKNSVKEAQTEAWDELEKSVLASVADDITVGVKGKRAEIVIVKSFV